MFSWEHGVPEPQLTWQAGAAKSDFDPELLKNPSPDGGGNHMVTILETMVQPVVPLLKEEGNRLKEMGKFISYRCTILRSV